MIESIKDAACLANGVKMPWLGLGTYRVEKDADVALAAKLAMKHGYRSIDTAAFYQNEAGVGQAVRDSGIPREEIFVTSKVWNSSQGYDLVLQAYEQSLHRLGLEYLDLFLVHWPVKDKFIDSWRALEKLYDEGRVRAIGVSNFQVHHLEELMAHSRIVPMVNQVELHPLLAQTELLDFCRLHNIQVEAWGPLMRGKLEIPALVELGQKYSKSPAQIILRWDLQNQVIAIPKSVHEERIRQNADIFDFELTPEDCAAITALNRNQRFGPDPDNFDF